MKKFLLPGIVAVLSFVFPSRSQAVPIDVPYVTLISSNNTGSILLSSTTFPNGNSTVNANIANNQWCVTHVVVTGSVSPTTFTMAWSTAPFTQPFTTATTDYRVLISSTPYDEAWPYRQPYCSPVGQTFLTITSSVATAVIQVEGYLFKGWNP